MKKVLIEDIVESEEEGIEIFYDENSNTILQIKTSNMYHNAFYQYVTYFVSKENNLVRIESLKKFDKLKLDDEFFNNAYIDILTNEVERFEIVKIKDNDKAYSLLLKREKEVIEIFGSLKI